MVELVIYVALCAVTGLFGMERRMGFIGTFLLTLLTTPLIMIPVLLLTGRSARAQSDDRS
jgi:hypothetical protein